MNRGRPFIAYSSLIVISLIFSAQGDEFWALLFLRNSVNACISQYSLV